MGRGPTLPSIAYRWHRAAMAGKTPAITHEPECGWFRRKLVKGGPYVPVRIFLEQETDPETGELLGDEIMRCEVAGKRRPPEEEWTWVADKPISREEYLEMVSGSFAGTAEAPEPKYHF
jgi:hypothetical protein